MIIHTMNICFALLIVDSATLMQHKTSIRRALDFGFGAYGWALPGLAGGKRARLRNTGRRNMNKTKILNSKANSKKWSAYIQPHSKFKVNSFIH